MDVNESSYEKSGAGLNAPDWTNNTILKRFNKDVTVLLMLGSITDDQTRINMPSPKLFVTSDRHIGHKRIIEYASRPFRDLDEMHTQLLERWNAVVTPDDFVLDLGDLIFYSSDWMPEYLRAFNGRTILIKGNHDSDKMTKKLMSMNLIHKVIKGELFIGRDVVFSHAPSLPTVVTRKMKTNDLNYRNYHGHIHERNLTYKFCTNFCVEQHDYTPVDLRPYLFDDEYDELKKVFEE